ncbi:proteoglycan 4-like [Boleophthalmus pectinirostris]|uniref:proteoglycan 4-like n=1 Tax=Boleophthalmus pectinirostris TaxID=150288 RepID=UPI00242DE823|nr:proteoglycan 4-like [Boleophthalmus pectinirostris]
MLVAVDHGDISVAADSESDLRPLDSGSCSTLASSVIEVETELNQDLDRDLDPTNPDQSQDQKNPEHEQSHPPQHQPHPPKPPPPPNTSPTPQQPAPPPNTSPTPQPSPPPPTTSPTPPTPAPPPNQPTPPPNTSPTPPHLPPQHQPHPPTTSPPPPTTSPPTPGPTPPTPAPPPTPAHPPNNQPTPPNTSPPPNPQPHQPTSHQPHPPQQPAPPPTPAHPPNQPHPPTPAPPPQQPAHPPQNPTPSTTRTELQMNQNKTGCSNFTCPLPPMASPGSPKPPPTTHQEEKPTMHQDTLPTMHLEDTPAAATEPENPPTTHQEQTETEKTNEEDVEQNGDQRETKPENAAVFEEEESPVGQTIQETIPESADDKICEETKSSEAKTEVEKLNKDAERCLVDEEPKVRRRDGLTRGSTRRKRDKKIIEKIRSYYEAAAEAEDNGGSAEEEENSAAIFGENAEVSKMSTEEEKEERDVTQNGGEVCPDVRGEVEERSRKESERKEDESVSARKPEPKNISGDSGVCKKDAKPKEEEGKGAAKAGKAGPWSRHSRIVSANRALFEGMASDVERMGLFEASPVVDPVLLENSERILNKVQTSRGGTSTAGAGRGGGVAGAGAGAAGAGAGPARGNGQSQSGKTAANEKRSFIRADERPAQTKNQTRTQSRTFQSPGSRPDQSRVQEREKRTDTDCVVVDHVTVAEPLSSNGVAPSTSHDLLSASGSGGRPGPSLTQDQSPDLGHSSSDGPLKTSRPPQETESAASGESRRVDIVSTLSHDSETGEAREAGAEDPLPPSPDPPPLPRDDAPQLGNAGPDLPPRRPGAPETPETAPKTIPGHISETSGAGREDEGAGAAGTPVQFPQIKADKQNSDDVMVGTRAKEGNVHPENHTPAVTHPGFSRQQPEFKALYVGYKSRDAPPSRGGPEPTSEKAQKHAPIPGHKSRDVPPADSGAQQNRSPPGSAQAQAQKHAPNLGPERRDVAPPSASGSGAPTAPEPKAPPAPPSCAWTTTTVQSPVWTKDPLPTFTNQRPTDLPRAQTRTGTRTSTGTGPEPHREQRLAGASPRPSSRSGLESPSLAALLPPAGPSSSSAFRPNLHQRPPSPIFSPPENPTHHDPRPPNATPRAPRPPPPPPSSVFTRSLAASCISQSISQSIAKKMTEKSNPAPLPSTLHLRQRSPSPKLPTESTQQPKSFLWSPQSLVNHPARQNTTNPHGNANNNNANVGGGVSSPHAAHWAANANANANASASANANASASAELAHDSSWSNSHNRVARPFCTSEPNSRVQSPTSFHHSAPQHDFHSPLANKPPNPRRPGSSHNPLGLTLDINRAASVSSSLSPRVTSPPPIGSSLNAWTNHIAAPQPRNPRGFSPCPSPTSAYPSSLRNSRSSSPSPPFSPPSQSSLRRSHSTTLADRPPSPARTHAGGARRSWVETSRRSLTFHGPFDQPEPSFHGPRSGFSSPALACLSPRTALPSPVSPLSPGRCSPGRSAFTGQQFGGVPWSDEISRSFGHDLKWSEPSLPDWGDAQVEDGTCRSQIICAYVARPPRPSNHQPQPAPLAPPSAAKPPNQKMSYATTVNLQIAGSGRIKAFSTAQVSLTQTLQHGASPQGALARRVSVHGAPP